MSRIADSTCRNLLAVIVTAAACATLGCSSDPPPPPDLTPPAAISQIFARWSNEELSHFKITFHSDTLIDCGVNNGIWKLVEVRDSSGQAWSTAYQLTERGKQMLSAIDLKESGRGHEITLRGPYRLEITSISDGPQPTNKRVGLRWSIDWDAASPELKACMPRFELAGSEVALFELNDQNWRFASYASPGDAAAAPGGGSVLDKLH